MLEVMDSAVMAAKPHPFVDAPVNRRTEGAMDARAVRRPRKVHVYCNGDRFFRGKLVHLNLNRYRNFNDLLNDLTGKLPNTMHLTYGVRQIFTPVTGRKIRDISQMQDGQEYVCAGFETFKPMKYGSDAVTESWSFGRSRAGGGGGGGGSGVEPFGDSSKSSPPSFGGPNAFHPQRHIHPKPLTGQKFTTLRPGIWSIHASTDSFAKPKVITIFRSGIKPCPNVKILLNRHGVQSLDQLLRDVSEAFGPKWTGNRLRKLYSIRGREVSSTGDFFRDDDIFVGVGDNDPSLAEVSEILDQLYPDSSYADRLLRKWEHAKKRRNRQAGRRKEVFLERDIESKADMGAEDGGDKRRQDKEDALANDSIFEKKMERLSDRETARKTGVEHFRGNVSVEDSLRSNEAKDGVSGRNTRTDENNRVRRSQVNPKQKRKKVLDCEESEQSQLQEQELEKERESEKDMEKEREKEMGRMAEQERQRQKEQERERQKQKEEEEEKEREDMERTKEQERERKRQRDKEKESKMEKDLEREKEQREKEKEKEREREKEREMERAREKEKERELEREKETQIQRRRKPQVRLKPIHDPWRGNASRNRHEKEDANFDSNREGDVRLRYIQKDDLVTPRDKGSLRDLMTVEPITSPGRKVVKRGEDIGKCCEEQPKNDQNNDDSEQKDSEDDLERQAAKRSNTKEFRILSSHSRKNEVLKEKFTKDENKANDAKTKAEVETQSDVLQNRMVGAGDENKESVPPGDTSKVPPRKKRSKPIIYKSKMERQISNVELVSEKYELGKVLGDGNFAVVRQCRHRSSNHEYAMKVIDKSKLRGKESMIENEIVLMKACDHPNIVKLYEEYETKAEIFLVMELVKGGDLFDAITQRVKFNEVDTAKMVFDLAQALYYLHSRAVVHRDLKPENILVHHGVGGERSLKLADFGLAMEVSDPIYTVCGTPTYVAPEILSEIGYGLEIDMWALGVITYILLCGFPPFRSAERKQTELFEFIKSGEFEFLSPYWDNNSKGAKSLINHLLVVDRKKRYSAVDVLCDPFVVTFAGSKPEPDLKLITTNLQHKLDQQARQNREQFRLQMMKRRL